MAATAPCLLQEPAEDAGTALGGRSPIEVPTLVPMPLPTLLPMPVLMRLLTRTDDGADAPADRGPTPEPMGY